MFCREIENCTYLPMCALICIFSLKGLDLFVGYHQYIFSFFFFFFGSKQSFFGRISNLKFLKNDIVIQPCVCRRVGGFRNLLCWRFSQLCLLSCKVVLVAHNNHSGNPEDSARASPFFVYIIGALFRCFPKLYFFSVKKKKKSFSQQLF